MSANPGSVKDMETPTSTKTRDEGKVVSPGGEENKPSTTEEIMTCPDEKCGEIIHRNKKGRLPKHCPWCNEDLSSLSSAKTDLTAESQDQETKVKGECPNKRCGVKIPRNKKGQFPKLCIECDEDLSALIKDDIVSRQQSKKKVTEKRPKLVVKIQPLTAYSECGFCCLKLIEIEDPRVLPCGHIQCTQCIEGNINQPEITCKVCRKPFADLSIEILPEVPQKMINEALVPANQRCDLCKAGPVKATRCCADCKKKLCDAHAAEHDEHVSHHEQLLLEDGLAPERYEVQRCDNHENHVLNEICKHCMKLFCNRCNTRGLCSKTAGTLDDVSCSSSLNKPENNLETANESAHEVVPLREVTDELREKMRSLSQQLYDKMKRCRNLEKTTWRRLSDLEEHVLRQCNAVDRIAEELITNINQLRVDIKLELQTYATEASTDVEKYSEEILISITVLDDQFRYGQDLADRTPDKAILDEFNQKESEMKQAAGDMTLERVISMKRPYLNAGIPVVDLCTKVIREPAGLDFISKKKTSGACYGVNGTKDGSRVICAMDGGVEVRGDDGELIRKVDIDDPQQTLSAHLMADTLYTQLSSTTTNKYLTYVGTLDEPLQTLLHEVGYEGNGYIHHISVSHNTLAIIVRENKEIRICTLDGTHMFDIKLIDMGHPFGVKLLPADNSVLVTDLEGNQLRKYRLEPDAEPVWTCPGLMIPSGVTTDESGLIYVTGNSTGTIHLISPQGEKVKELNHPMLKASADKKNWIHDISVSDGRMVVACRGEGVMYFNLL